MLNRVIIIPTKNLWRYMLMYDKDALQRRISKEGVNQTIEDLQKTHFDKETIRKLESLNIFRNGTPNIPFIISLSVM